MCFSTGALVLCSTEQIMLDKFNNLRSWLGQPSAIQRCLRTRWLHHAAAGCIPVVTLEQRRKFNRLIYGRHMIIFCFCLCLFFSSESFFYLFRND